MSNWEIKLPKPVHLKAVAAGEVGLRWITQLGDIVSALEERWQIRVGDPLSGGSESLVLPVEQADGSSAIAKIGLPSVCDVTNEARILRLANGRGYAQLYQFDVEHNAILVERLGAPLAKSNKSTMQQLATICSTLQSAWVDLQSPHDLMTGAEKAQWLAQFIESTWQKLGIPCSIATRNRAIAFAEERRSAHHSSKCVLVHGDAHEFNTLTASEDPVVSGTNGSADAEADTHKFIDPDGLFAEPACDLAVLMRGFNADLLVGDVVHRALHRCEQLADWTSIDTSAIWQWGFMERVSTGLLLLDIGLTDEGKEMLSIADLLADETLV